MAWEASRTWTAEDEAAFQAEHKQFVFDELALLRSLAAVLLHVLGPGRAG